MKISVLFFLLLSPTTTTALALSGLPSLSKGNYLTTLDKETEYLVSSKGTFSAGFYKVGTNAYCFSIWFTKSVSKTVVWMSNRDTPVGENSKITLHKNGNLILTDSYGSIVWSTATISGGDFELRLLETGNLVLSLTNQAKRVIWESFDFPTDTLLPLQPLLKNTTLVSMRSKGTYFSGVYNFKYTDDNVLELIFNGPLLSSIYWPNPSLNFFQNGRTPYNSTRMAILDEIGEFKSSDNLLFNATDYGFGPKRRITLDYDGILRSYSLNESNGLWEISWLPDRLDACSVHGICGEYGVCTYNKEPTCSCPYGFVRKDPSDSSKGCSPSFNLTSNLNKLDFIELFNTDYFGYDLQSYASGVSYEACRTSCLTDSNCKGFGYGIDGGGLCFPKSKLINGLHMPNSPRIMHIKVLKEIVLLNNSQQQQQSIKAYNLNCSVASKFSLYNSEIDEQENNKNGYMNYLIAFVSSFAVIEVTCIGLGWWFIFRKHSHDEFKNVGYIALALGFKRFSFKELKKATKNFKQEIGRGGFGTVYKGVLDDERVVAVKRLEGVLQGDSEFWAEVSIIGNINHRNLVKLWGFCAENEHKLLVYEYVENSSLDKYLFSSNSSSETLGLDHRYKIALGTAKGLSYLHEECLEWVLHCDVKSQNILLDENFEPKVSDFGLSKLFKDTQDVGFSKVRGTRGYLAPEWILNMKIDAKADVYSYGIVFLELLSGRSASGFISTSSTNDNQLFNQLVKWVSEKIKQGGLKEVIDPRLLQEFNQKKLERLIEVAMLCVQEDRNSRPAMSKVVELLLQTDEQVLA